MSAVARPGSPWEAFQDGLVAAGDRDPSLYLVEVAPSAGSPASPFAERFPARCARLPATEAEVVRTAADRAASGAPVFLAAPAGFLVDLAFPGLVRSLILPRRNAKLVGLPADTAAGSAEAGPGARDDVGAMRGLPSMTVVAPADGPTTRAATVALAERDGPAYLRLPPREAAPLTDGTFAVGRAHELRAGADLTIAAWGPGVPPSLAVAADLARVGISTRVLDLASLKPIDEAAILRAARDTGAILVVEAAPLDTGIGTLVAAMTAENHPVPVRRLGLPDVGTGTEPLGPPDRGAAPNERLRDEAWELLRLRGKAT